MNRRISFLLAATLFSCAPISLEGALCRLDAGSAACPEPGLVCVYSAEFNEGRCVPFVADAGVRDSGFGDAGSDGGTDGGSDGGADGGTDAGADAGVDAGVDAGSDAGIDGGLDAGALRRSFVMGANDAFPPAGYGDRVVVFYASASNIWRVAFGVDGPLSPAASGLPGPVVASYALDGVGVAVGSPNSNPDSGFVQFFELTFDGGSLAPLRPVTLDFIPRAANLFREGAQLRAAVYGSTFQRNNLVVQAPFVDAGNDAMQTAFTCMPGVFVTPHDILQQLLSDGDGGPGYVTGTVTGPCAGAQNITGSGGFITNSSGFTNTAVGFNANTSRRVVLGRFGTQLAAAYEIGSANVAGPVSGAMAPAANGLSLPQLLETVDLVGTDAGFFLVGHVLDSDAGTARDVAVAAVDPFSGGSTRFTVFAAPGDQEAKGAVWLDAAGTLAVAGRCFAGGSGYCGDTTPKAFVLMLDVARLR